MSTVRSSRRAFLKTVGAGSAALALPRLARGAESGERRPNVLFMAIDDLNDWVGCLGGHPDVQTPHLDRLAARGVLFTNAYCAAPACNPSRAALMTGIRPSTSGIYQNPQPWRDSPVLTTHGQFNHSVRSRDWRYIRYKDGGEELYDHRFDPLEWNNLAGDRRFTSVKRHLAHWLPEFNAPDGGRGEGRAMARPKRKARAHRGPAAGSR